MAALSTRTLRVPGATLTYDVREVSATHPPLLLIGAPMDASGFTTLAGYFGDRTVVTYDPRGIARSTSDDASAQPTPQEHAADVSQVISALDAGPVEVFGSSGGAVTGLALTATYPDQVTTLVAHEPPVVNMLSDREEVKAVCETIRDEYRASGIGPALARFIALSSRVGPVPRGHAEQPAPDPAAFDLPTEDDGSRDDPLMRQIITCTHFLPDFAALRAASSRIVLAGGDESEGQVAYRSALGVAAELGSELVVFPSHHTGFSGDEVLMPGTPEAFAAKLREVLDAD